MSILLDRLTKRYGSQAIVDQVSLEVSDGELFVLLGASGSGKSTILRLIAGLSQPDGGQIQIHGRDVTHLPPQQRGTGFVFQNYSIFRHMTIAENIEFGLTIRKVPKAECARRRDELLDLVGLTGLGNRYSHQISGGQQQRVALARALAYEPAVLLLDEPFGALDVKIRSQLRRRLKQIQRQLHVTTILVTHDQEEAFELADRIGVIDRGRLLEVGGGEELYARPRTLFGATFLGAGTVLMGRADKDQARFGSLRVPLPPDTAHHDGDRVQMLFRPEQVLISETEPLASTPALGQGVIVEQTFAGDRRRVRVRVPRLSGVRQIAPALPFGEEGLLVDAVVPTDIALTRPDVWVCLRGWHILKSPQLRLLVYNTPQQDQPPFLPNHIADRLDGVVTAFSVAPASDTAGPLSTSLQRRYAEAGLAADVRVRAGEPGEQIAIELDESLYEFLVLPNTDGHEQRGRTNPLVSYAIDRIQESWTTPLLLLRGDRRQVARVLICTAAGEPGKSDVRIGGRLARRIGAAATLLYVARPGVQISQHAQHHLDQASATLRSLDVANEVRTRVAATPIEGILAEVNASDYDLIVIGSHRSPSRGLFGSENIMLQIVSSIDRPILIVPDDAI